jgi:hypothetical protein
LFASRHESKEKQREAKRSKVRYLDLMKMQVLAAREVLFRLDKGSPLQFVVEFAFGLVGGAGVCLWLLNLPQVFYSAAGV